MATEKDFNQKLEYELLNNLGIEEPDDFHFGFKTCLEFALLNGLPSDIPSVPLELKRAYLEIDQLLAKLQSLKDWREKWEKHNAYPEEKWEEFDLAFADVEVVKR